MRGIGWILLGQSRLEFCMKALLKPRPNYSLFDPLPPLLRVQDRAERKPALSSAIQHLFGQLPPPFAIMGDSLPRQLRHSGCHLDELRGIAEGCYSGTLSTHSNIGRGKSIDFPFPSSRGT